MKKIHFIILSAMMLMLIPACSEEKYFDFETTTYGKVDFVASVPIFPGDTARSAMQDVDRWGWDYYYPGDYRQNPVNIAFDYFDPYGYNWETYEQTGEWRNFNYSLERENMVFTVFGTTIKCTFQPSCPEEKEAVFIFPDGTEITATAQNPVVEWTVPVFEYFGEPVHEDYHYPFNYYSYLIEARSSFIKGKISYSNEGYVLFCNCPDKIWYNGNNFQYGLD